MKKFLIYIFIFSIIGLSFIGCTDEDNLFYVKVTTKNGFTTVSGIKPGGLESALLLRLAAIKKLAIIDTIDSRDFVTLRDKMPNLTELDLSKTVIATYNGYEGTAGSYNHFYTANSIPEFAFYNPSTSTGKNSLKTIILPSSISSIKDFAFNRSGLTGTLEIPSSVTDTIGKSAFAYCDGLSEIILAGTNYYGESAFMGCTNLSGDLSFPPGVQTFSEFAFANCESISVINIPETVEFIGNSAFNDSGNEIVVNSDNNYYSSLDGVLFNKDFSTLIQFPRKKSGIYLVPDGVSTIGKSAFENCSEVTTLTFPNSLQFIEDYAFKNCSSLAGNFPISSGIFYIGQYVFEDCPLITGFNISPENTLYQFVDDVLLDLSQVSLKKCLTLKSGAYTIPGDVFFIDNQAFSNCTKLTSVTIPETIFVIGQRAFYNCSLLTSIFAQSTTPIDLSSTPTAFEAVNKEKCTLYVPAGSRDTYLNTAVWNEFYNISEY